MKTILLILHQEHSTPGRIAHRLIDRGFRLDPRRPRFGDPLPETMHEHDGVIVFGGPMSANDSDEYVRREIEWSEVPLREEKPFFGICLGAQILARKLGAKVDFHPDGLVEVGYYPLRQHRKEQSFSIGQITSISGTGKALDCRMGPCVSPRAIRSPIRRFGTVVLRSVCSSIRNSRTT
jgi:GMP synthase-like glutamine amidotransferase